MPRGSPRFPDSIAAVGRQFARWRRRRRRGERIPESLWLAAGEAARRHGVSATALALGLNPARLKEHWSAAGEPMRPQAFVPLPPLALSASPGCVVEVEDGRGRRLRVELGGVSAGEAAVVARALWEAGG
jgi:hypothetical protein